jgi:biotin/methionine sulfoxide reductase
MPRYTATHWGIYQIEQTPGEEPRLDPFLRDPDPSPIGLSMLAASKGALRVRRPAVRRSWLQHGPGSHPELRGKDPFVEVSWDVALDLVAGELQRVISIHGNRAIFGGSYGWSSAGRFHHAQSQVHRFLNAAGGYVRSVDTYSLGAGRVLMPHIVAPMEDLSRNHTSWDVLAEHTGLFVSLGGVPAKNSQVSPGGVGEHNVALGLRRMREAGVRFINISPVRDDIDTGGEVEWIPIRPNTDTALLLALAYIVQREGWHDQAFLAGYTVGFERFLPYLLGKTDQQPKTAEWAESITGVPAGRIERLAREMHENRTMLTAAWALQRAHHGEQPFWMVVTLAAMLGQIGLPGGGFGLGYGALNLVGSAVPLMSGPTLSQGVNAVAEYIPVARIADMLEQPGAAFSYNGKTLHYPDIRLIYWAGGNPFHHHQDLNRLLDAWRKPEAIIVHEPFWTATARFADVVLPATTPLEREDLSFAQRERFIVAMKQVIEVQGEARDDYTIFLALAQRLGCDQEYGEGLDSRGWLRRLYDEWRVRTQQSGLILPDFDRFWSDGLLDLAADGKSPVVLLGDFRADPEAHPLATASGKIELFCQTIADFGYPDCPGHAQWFEPAEWLGGEQAETYPLHLISDQPYTKLHSQYDQASYSTRTRIEGREPITMHPEDARARGVVAEDIVRVWNGRGSCLAAVQVSDGVRPGVVKLSTGAWFDPGEGYQGRGLELHGNPNALTLDVGASSLSQGCAAQTCLVQIERWQADLPPLRAHAAPALLSE